MLDCLFDRVLGWHTEDLVCQVTLFEEEQGWDIPDREFGRCRLCLVDIHPENANTIDVLSGQTFEYRGNVFTGLTPGSPEIDDDWHWGSPDAVIEIAIGHRR